MKFFQSTAKFFGMVRATEKNNQVTISGLDGTILTNIMAKIFETNVINKWMFTQITNTALVLESFFIPDLVYMLTKLQADDSVRWGTKRTIDKMLHEILTKTWFKSSVQDHPPMIDVTKLAKLKWKPLPHQQEFLELYGDRMPRYDLTGVLLGAAPGTGKTMSDFMVATCIIPPEVAEVKIIISPKKAIHLVWEDTVRKLFKKVPPYWVAGDTKIMPTTGKEYYIFNYEQLDKALELGKALQASGRKFFIIVDESHNFADPKSARTKLLRSLHTLVPKTYFVWASGSPILKKAAELTTFLGCSDPRFTPEAEKRFNKIYSASPGRANEIFNHRLGQMMAFMVPKSVVSSTKPKVVELPVKLPASLAEKFLMENVREEMKAFIQERLKFYEGQMKSLRATVNQWLDYHETKLTTRPQRREFAQYLNDIKVISRNPDLMIKEVLTRARAYERSKLIPSLPPLERKKFRSALSAIKNIKLKVRGEALGTILAKRRSECAAALAVHCNPEQIMQESLSKTLFFASSVLPIKALTQHLEKKGFNPLMVYGGTNSQLVTMMHQFEKDPNINPVCATMQSLSEAVPVTAASTVVLLNRPYRQATWDQIIARADRLGQQHPVTVIETTLDTGGKPNVSSTQDDILASVRELINAMVGEEFAGPPVDEREYRVLIDASEADPDALDLDTLMAV